MISIPLPFVIALLLATLLGLVLARHEARYRPVVAFLGICIALMVVVGLRWTSGLGIFRFLQPAIAALVPPAAWLCFTRLRGTGGVPAWLHFLPAGVILNLSAPWMPLRVPTDVLFFFLFLGYGVLLLRRGLAGPDNLMAARLGEAEQAGRAAALAGGLLIFSAVVDLAVALDLGLGDGGHAARFVSASGLLMMPLIGWTTIMMARGIPEPAPSQEVASHPKTDRPDDDPQDDDVLAEVNRILAERKLYRDPDLTLDRLSRRLAIPARRVSGAINRKLGVNVSQAINDWRIREAMQLLADTDRPVTVIMLDCGFQTKSNFNREFSRVTGTSPSEWRRRARAAADVMVPQETATGS